MPTESPMPDLSEVQWLNEKLQEAHRQLDQYVELAERLGQALCPASLPAVEQLRFAVRHSQSMLPVGHLFDVRPVEANTLAFWLAEVPLTFAVSLLPLLVSAIRPVEWSGSQWSIVPPATVLNRCNGLLLSLALDPPPLIALTYGLIEHSTGQVTLARGGSPAPLQITRNAEVCSWHGPAPFLGAFPAEFATTSHILAKGDRLLLRTTAEEQSVLLAVRNHVDSAQFLRGVVEEGYRESSGTVLLIERDTE